MILKKDAVPTIYSQKAEASKVDNDNSADSRSNRQHRSVNKIVHICTYFEICFSIQVDRFRFTWHCSVIIFRPENVNICLNRL